MLLVLETLTPMERAVFVLREVFDFSYAEIASRDRPEPAPCGRSRTGRVSTSRPADRG